MNTANQITSARIFAAFLFMIFMSMNGLVYKYLALLLFIIAAISDLYDGKIARRYGQVTNIGKIMDPLADKILISSALIILVKENNIPAWMAIIIISREFAVTGLRTIASIEQKIIAADKFGKYKTAAQLVAIIVILTFIVFKNTITYSSGNSLENIFKQNGELGKYVFLLLTDSPYYLMFIAVIISIISGVNYFIQNKQMLFKEMQN